MQIKDIKKGQTYCIKNVNNLCNSNYCQRLANFGICAGSKIELMRVSPFGDTIELKVNNKTSVCLRKKECGFIEVTK